MNENNFFNICTFKLYAIFSKMEERVHRTQMPLLPAEANRGITPVWKKCYL